MAEPSPTADRGHRSLPHTADAIIEAWAGSFGQCLEELVSGFAARYLETPTADIAAVTVSVPPGSVRSTVLALLDEVIFRNDTTDQVVVGLEVVEIGSAGMNGELKVVPAGAVEVTGAVPKAITTHGLEIDEQDDRWTIRVTVDV